MGKIADFVSRRSGLILWTVIAAAILWGVASFSNYERTIGSAQDRVRAVLKDPDSADFENVRSFVDPTDRKNVVVCGYVNSRNSFGGMNGPQRFIVGGVVVLEEQVDIDVMNGVWDKMCAGKELW